MMDRYIELKPGSHDDPKDGLCIMEAVAWWFGEKHTDSPECVSPVLRTYCIDINDFMPDDQRQRLLPYVPRLAGTAGDGMDKARAKMAAMRAVNVFAAKALRAHGLDDHADACEQAGTLEEARQVAHAARTEAAAKVAVHATAHAAGTAASAAAVCADGCAAFAAGYAATAAHAAATAADAAADAAYGVWDDALALLDDMLALGAEKRGLVSQVRNLAEAPCAQAVA